LHGNRFPQQRRTGGQNLSPRTRITQAGRGGECRIAVSTAGRKFETIWTATKEDFAKTLNLLLHMTRAA
jgi:hypothetical protein